MIFIPYVLALVIAIITGIVYAIQSYRELSEVSNPHIKLEDNAQSSKDAKHFKIVNK